MPRYWIARRVGSLPSCHRWYGFDAEDITRGPLTGSRRTKAEIVADLTGSEAVVLTETQCEALPLYVRMRETGEMTLTREEEQHVGRLRAIAKAEGLILAQSRQKGTHWSRRTGPLQVAAVIPESGGLIARFDRTVTTIETGDML